MWDSSDGLMRRSGCFMVALLAVLPHGCALSPRQAPEPESAYSVFEIQDRAISESSGLVRSRRHPGVFWTHNDSGDSPRIFAITVEGRTLAEFAVEGAEAVDWEDIAIDDAGNLYIGDVGNNDNRRRDLAVYRVPEPDPALAGREIPVTAKLRYRYGDQQAFPERNNSIFDAEAIFWRDDSVYIFTKHRTDTHTTLYRLPTTAHRGERVLDPVAQLDLGWTDRRTGNVTAADISADGKTLALLTYKHLHLFAVSGRGDAIDLHPLKRIELDSIVTQQAESLCWDEGRLLFGNEQRDLFRIPNPLSEALTRFPPDSGPGRAGERD